MVRIGLVLYGLLRENVGSHVWSGMVTSCLARHDLRMSDLNIAESTSDRWKVVQNGVVSETVTNVKDGWEGRTNGSGEGAA